MSNYQLTLLFLTLVHTNFQCVVFLCTSECSNVVLIEPYWKLIKFTVTGCDTTSNNMHCVGWSSLINMLDNRSQRLYFIMREHSGIYSSFKTCIFSLLISVALFTHTEAHFLFLTSSLLAILFHFIYPLLNYFETFMSFLFSFLQYKPLA